MMTPFLMLSSTIMIISTVLSISSTNWLFLWAGLELNLLSFIPIMMHSKNTQETEAAVKYFLIQAAGSSIILMMSMSMWFYMNGPHQHIAMLILLAIFMKMGIAPFHSWYSSVMTSLSWMAALILSTWQKLGPLIIVTFMFSNFMNNMLLFMACLNAITGGLLGINQSHLRTIMAYSSITHMGWMISLIAIGKPLAVLMYFFTYCMIISPLFIIMQIKNLSNSSNLNKLMNHSPMYQFIVPMILLSLSGIPPLTGFIPKWMTISILSFSSPVALILMIIGAMMNTYFYLNIAFNFMLSSNTSTYSSKTDYHFYPILLTSTATMYLIPFPLFMML